MKLTHINQDSVVANFEIKNKRLSSVYWWSASYTEDFQGNYYKIEGLTFQSLESIQYFHQIKSKEILYWPIPLNITEVDTMLAEIYLVDNFPLFLKGAGIDSISEDVMSNQKLALNFNNIPQKGYLYFVFRDILLKQKKQSIKVEIAY